MGKLMMNRLRPETLHVELLATFSTGPRPLNTWLKAQGHVSTDINKKTEFK